MGQDMKSSLEICRSHGKVCWNRSSMVIGTPMPVGGMLLVVAVVKTDVKPSHDGCLCDGVIVGVFVGCFGHTLAICSSARRRHGKCVVGMVWFCDFCRRVLDMCRHVYSCVGVRGASVCWTAGCHSGAYGVERSLSLPSTILRIITNELWGKFFVNMSAY